MTTQQRHQNLSDAREILMASCAGMPDNSPALELLRSAYGKIEEQMVILESLLLADDSHECGCGEVVENGADHQCGYIDGCAQEDEQSRHYAQRVM